MFFWKTECCALLQAPHAGKTTANLFLHRFCSPYASPAINRIHTPLSVNTGSCSGL